MTFDVAATVECPWCGAKPGKRCTTGSGRKTGTHSDRYFVAAVKRDRDAATRANWIGVACTDIGCDNGAEHPPGGVPVDERTGMPFKYEADLGWFCPTCAISRAKEADDAGH